ncbi:phosphodiester glycosidase family protein [Bacteroides gallinarum]|uniref:phosphodiester glycosidase family protein n=1 Tax=Bacteroides gallinarum TaxID=376806 RepID=UPI0003739378|nr:phosphodiester glycosidase family protein [Bacteroides gallinarum]
MKKSLLILLIEILSISLYAQTKSDSLAIVSAQWEVQELVKGITHKKILISNLYGGTQHINILFIDPKTNKKIDIAVSDTLMKTSDMALKNGAMAAINGSYFNMKVGNSVCFLKVGTELKDTTTIKEWQARVTGAIRVHKGKLELFPWNKQIETKYTKKKGTTLASGPLLLLNGREYDWTMCAQEFIETKHPRSAVAVTEKGMVLFITVDGRMPGFADGVNIRELAHLTRVLGGKDAINLDGGGSTTLWLAGVSHSGVLNCPCDNGKFDHMGERKVANILYVYE